MRMRIPHNRPPVIGTELDYIADALKSRHLSGDGAYTQRCQAWLAQRIGGDARLTHSCTGALEMAALLSEVGPGDEVIMPSFTFASTANAFVLRGAVPVFVDIRWDTLNINAERIEEAVTPRSKAIVAVHYAGVCADMDSVQKVADRHRLLVIEDAAQALCSSYNGRPAGSLSEMSCFSFHETKNVVSGEGGAIVVNVERFVERADVIREKGTNRVAFRQKKVDKYTWIDVGSSYLPSEIMAASLWAQLERAQDITSRRLQLWDRYHQAFAGLEQMERARRPIIPENCDHNGHIYYLLLPGRSARDALIGGLAADGILAPFHYIPLHSAPAGLRYGRVGGSLEFTDRASDCLIRLPLYVEIGDDQDFVIDRVISHLKAQAG
jgi:dTDP-4-amino-4,6-dideoxygalactose transaminase